jgi:hypothetical protein
MDPKYILLNQYRLSRRMTMTAFSREIGLSIDVVRRALFGITKPHDYHQVVFDEYISRHQDDIIEKCNIIS